MKFNIYYGSGNEFKNQQLINSFDTIKKAEKFLLGYIKSVTQTVVMLEQISFQTAKTIWLWTLYKVLHNYKRIEFGLYVGIRIEGKFKW